jgi:F0F1-type ATP synthase beta subunit
MELINNIAKAHGVSVFGGVEEHVKVTTYTWK